MQKNTNTLRHFRQNIFLLIQMQYLKYSLKCSFSIKILRSVSACRYKIEPLTQFYIFNISFLGLYIFILYIYIYIFTTLPYIPSPLVKKIKALSLITYRKSLLLKESTFTYKRNICSHKTYTFLILQTKSSQNFCILPHFDI